MLSAGAQEWNERNRRAGEFHATEGRALRDIERELRAIKSLLSALVKHLGADADRRSY
mgnify:FL=1